MNADELFDRYQELQRYVGWTDEDALRVRSVATIVERHFAGLIEDFYAEIEQHAATRKIITGGEQQVARLKGTLITWLRELFSGQYDRDYVTRRWKVGLRHVEIGLDQVYTNTALSRLRSGLLLALEQEEMDLAQLAVRRSLNKLIDLDLAIIEDAYQAEMQQRQQRIERLATIGQVAGGIAHELRNPLNVVKTSVYYLRQASQPSPEKVSTHLERIDRQVTMADGVIAALNNFARLPVPEMQPLDLASCIREVLELQPLPDQIKLSMEFTPNLPAVMGDRGQLAIVLSNLLRNARDAMPNGGSLQIRGRQNGGQVEIDVADSGVGIPRDHLARVMEPLFSTKARGIGLGLAITRAIIEKHNGHLKVTSDEGCGSTFTVTLTAARKDPDTSES
ncbi:MAG: histidine kinase [Planctomycetes bacterium]|nr:histidine kinase [Planctomycetota bacterium]